MTHHNESKFMSHKLFMNKSSNFLEELRFDKFLVQISIFQKCGHTGQLQFWIHPKSSFIQFYHFHAEILRTGLL